MASVLIGNSCQTQTLQGLGRMGVYISSIFYDTVYCEILYSIVKLYDYNYTYVYTYKCLCVYQYIFTLCCQYDIHICVYIYIYIYYIMLPVVPHKAVAEVSKIGNL